MVIDSKQYNGLCSCGRTHAMETALCVVEAGCLNRVDAHMRAYGLEGYRVAVYDENTYAATTDRHPAADMEIVLPADNLHANEHGVDLLLERLPDRVECLLAVGSGTIHDIVRYTAYQKRIPFVSCPTAASVDGFCSSVAAMTWHGCKKTLTAVAPTMVLADLDIIKKAPLRLAKSGFGDMVGKYVALTDWQIANVLTGEFHCERIATMTMEATRGAVACIEGIVAGDESAYEKLTYGLLLSGLAMQMIGNSRPASGAEHHISHLIEMKPERVSIAFEALHGEKVGVGTLLVLSRYQQVREKAAPVFADYTKAPVDSLERVFGIERVPDVEKENADDAAVGITGELVKETWPAVLQVLATLPDVSWLKQLYAKAALPASLQDIGVPDEAADFLLQYAPLVRNRLTLLRLLSRGVIC